MDQQEVLSKIKNKHDKKEVNRGQVNIQNWITQQTEQNKLNQAPQISKGHQQQISQQQQGYNLNFQSNQQQKQPFGSVPKQQNISNQGKNPQQQKMTKEEAYYQQQKGHQGVMNQQGEEDSDYSNEYQNNENSSDEEIPQPQNEEKRSLLRMNGNGYIQTNLLETNPSHIQQFKQNSSNRHYQLGELLQQPQDGVGHIAFMGDNVQNKSGKQNQMINDQDEQQRNARNKIPQMSMSYERSIQQKLQQEQQLQIQAQQQDLRYQIRDSQYNHVNEDHSQSFSQEYTPSQEQRMKVEIIERQFQKSVPNKIYTFPRKFSDSDDFSETEGDSSFESLQDVTEYDLNSQNIPKQQRVPRNEQTSSVNRELDSLQRSFQNSIFHLINNQAGPQAQNNNSGSSAQHNIINHHSQNHQTHNQQQQQNINNIAAQNNIPLQRQPQNQQTQILQHNQQQNNQQITGQTQQQQKLNQSNYLNYLSSSNLLSDQTNGGDTFISNGGENNENFRKSLKIDMGLLSKSSKQNQEMEKQNGNQGNASGEKMQARVMKKILQEGGVKFSNNNINNDLEKRKNTGNSNQADKVTKFTFDNKEQQNKKTQIAEPLTVEDYNFGADEDEEGNDEDQCNYKNHTTHDGENYYGYEENNFTKGDYDRRLKTEGNDLNDDEEDSEAAHKLYDNTESELSEDVVRIPLSSQQNKYQNPNQQSSTSSASRQLNPDIFKSNELNMLQLKQIPDFTKQKLTHNNNASTISANFNSTSNNSNKNFNVMNGAISTNSQTSNAYHSMNVQLNNPIDSVTNKQIHNQDTNEYNSLQVKQNLQRPSSSIQGTSTNLSQTQKKKKQQVRLMETLKMTVTNQNVFRSQVQNSSQQRQQNKTISKSKENVSASMNCNTISDLIKKQDISKTSKKQPLNQQSAFLNKRETPSQMSKQRQTVYTSIGSMNNYSLLQDQQGSVEIVAQQMGNNNSNLLEIPSNPLPSKVVKRVSSQVRGSKIRNHRLKTDSSNPSCLAANHTTANIHNHNQSKLDKSRERTASASKKKVVSPLPQNTQYFNNQSTNNIQSSKSTSQVDKFKKELTTSKSATQKIDKTPIRNKTNEQNQNSNKNTASKKPNVSTGQYHHQHNQSNTIVNQPAQQFLQYAAKQQEKQNQLNQQNIIHKYSSSPDNYATAAASHHHYLNFNQQNPTQLLQSQVQMNSQNQQNQPLSNNYMVNQQSHQLQNQQQIHQSLIQQAIFQQIQQGVIQDNSNSSPHLQQLQYQQQMYQNQHIQQHQQLNQNPNLAPQNQIQQILMNAQQNLAKQNAILANNQKQNINLRQVSPNQMIDDNEKNRITQNKLYQQAKSSLARCRNDDDTPKQISKVQASSQGGNNFNKKPIVMTSLDKSSKEKIRTSATGHDKLKTRIKTEPADYDDSSFIFNSNRNNSSKPHISQQLNSFLVQDNQNLKTEISKNINQSQNRANKSTTRTRNKQGERLRIFENENSRGESSTEKDQNNTLKALLLMQKKK